jgi:hypothetical protein
MHRDNNRLYGRQHQIRTFEYLLRQERGRLWVIHGPGGIGKTALLLRFRDLCLQQRIPVLHLDWQTLTKELTQGPVDAVTLWLHARTAPGLRAREGGAHPWRFTALCRNLAADPVLELGELLALSALWYRLRRKRLLANPERALLQAMESDRPGQPLVLLVDNQDLAFHHPVRTRLQHLTRGNLGFAELFERLESSCL